MSSRERVRALVAPVVLGAAAVAAACGGSGATVAPTAPTSTRIIAVAGNPAFGEVQAGTGVRLDFTIANTGSETLAVGTIAGTGPSPSQASLSWSSGTIAPGATQTVTLTFVPVSVGSYAGVLTVHGDQTSGVNTLPYSATVLPATPFTGNWSGNYIVDGCQGCGSMQDLLCSAPSGSRPGGVYPVGTLLPISLTLTQSGSDVSGTLVLSDVRGTVTGTAENGLLALKGTLTGPVRASIVHWSTRVIGKTMDGNAAYSVEFANLSGMGVMVTRLVVTKP